MAAQVFSGPQHGTRTPPPQSAARHVTAGQAAQQHCSTAAPTTEQQHQPHRDVAKWPKAPVSKTGIRGFESLHLCESRKIPRAPDPRRPKRSQSWRSEPLARGTGLTVKGPWGHLSRPTQIPPKTRDADGGKLNNGYSEKRARPGQPHTNPAPTGAPGRRPRHPGYRLAQPFRVAAPRPPRHRTHPDHDGFKEPARRRGEHRPGTGCTGTPGPPRRGDPEHTLSRRLSNWPLSGL